MRESEAIVHQYTRAVMYTVRIIPRRAAIMSIVLLIAALQSCASSVRFSSSRTIQTTNSTRTATAPRDLSPTTEFEGYASFYADEYHGRPTASGELFDQSVLTAAHRDLAFGTMLRVTNLRNNLSVVVRINDRGPFVGGRVLDLSRSAAEKIGMLRDGVVPIRASILPP